MKILTFRTSRKNIKEQNTHQTFVIDKVHCRLSLDNTFIALEDKFSVLYEMILALHKSYCHHVTTEQFM